MVLLPLLYLVHFFLGLLEWHSSSAAVGEQPNAALPWAARVFVLVVVTAGVILLTVAALSWQSQNPAWFISYLAVAVAASTLKIRLPRMRASLTPSFVLVLVAILGFSFAETVVMAAVTGAVQVLWRPKRRPMLAQVVFSPASLALGAAFAYVVSRVALAPWLGDSVVGVLVVSTMVLYGSNSLLVATVLALVDRKPLSSVWQLCYFWSLPYYLVGAAVAGVMMTTCRTADWPPSLLVLPLMGLVYASYREHMRQAVDRMEQAPT